MKKEKNCNRSYELTGDVKHTPNKEVGKRNGSRLELWADCEVELFLNVTLECEVKTRD